MSYTLDEVTYFVQDNFFLNCFLMIVFLLILYLLTNMLQRFRIRTLFIVSCLFIVGLTVYLIVDINMHPTWDSAAVIQAAAELKQGNYTMMQFDNYIFRYPFQIPVVLYFLLLTSLFGTKFIAFQLVNVGFLIGTYYFLTKSVQLQTSSKKTIIIAMLFFTLFFPLHMYVIFLYSNIPSVFFMTMGIYFGIKYFSTHSPQYIVITFVSLCIAALFKGTAYISMIAFVILLIIDFFKKFSFKAVTVSILSLLLVIPIPSILKFFISSQDKSILLNNDAFTKIALVMGTSWGSRSAGWYNSYAYVIYELYPDDIEGIKNASSKQFIENLTLLLANPQDLYTFFNTKLSSLWANPEFQGFWTIQTNKNSQWGTGDPETQSFLSIEYNQKSDHYGYFTGSFMLGKLNQLIRGYLNIFLNIIYLFSLYYLLMNRKKMDPINLLHTLTFIGGFLFLAFWEAKGQYSILFFILLFPGAAMGCELFFEDVKKLAQKRVIKQKN